MESIHISASDGENRNKGNVTKNTNNADNHEKNAIN